MKTHPCEIVSTVELLRGFWSHNRVVSKSISSHSFDFFENFFSGIDRPEHSAQKSVSVALARQLSGR